MIVECYSMDLYCKYWDSKDHQAPYDYFPRQFTGHNRKMCIAQAKKDGWKFLVQEDDAICKHCQARGIKN